MQQAGVPNVMIDTCCTKALRTITLNPLENVENFVLIQQQ